MRHVLVACCLFVFRPATAAEVISPAQVPRQETIEYAEVWRTDADSDEYLMGNVQAATRDGAGNLYLLDVQLQEVFRFSPAGEYLGTVARKGEGPGEINQVWSIHWWAPDSLILPHAFPPRVVRVSTEGVPQDELRVYKEEGAESPESVTAFAAVGDHAVVGGSTFVFSGEESKSVQWLGTIDRDGQVRHLFGERSIPMGMDPMKQKFDELEEFWSWDRWALGPDGRIYSAPERDAYAIAVHDLDGQELARWSRPIPPRERSKEELEALEGSRAFYFNGQKAEVEAKLSKLQPPIADLHCFDDQLWIVLDQGTEPEHWATVAVHDLDGTLLADRVLQVPHDRNNDLVLPLDAEHVLVIENGIGAAASQFAAFSGEEENEALNADPIEVVLYRAR